MTATDLKKMAFESIKDEISSVQKLMELEAENGQLKLVTEKISDAAKVYFTEKGFKFKVYLEAGKEIGTSNKIMLSWE